MGWLCLNLLARGGKFEWFDVKTTRDQNINVWEFQASRSRHKMLIAKHIMHDFTEY